MKMRVIPAGTFTMGCTPGAGECEDDEKPAHKVTLTRSFLLGETEVTQGQWMAVMGSNPSRFSSCGSDCPVENVSWLDAVAFANALSKKEGLEACYAVSGEAVSWRKGAACTGYRLPTEAEWEYAARAGRDSLYAGGDELGAVGWYTDNAGGTTHRVAQKGANDWGLFDVTGNVWEWNWDRYGAYPTGTVSDPAGASDGLGRVARGGSWLNSARSARLAYRDGDLPGYRISVLGLRLARSLP
jgi:formylglycine-generating enzyme required for sulfatase activity